MTDYTPLFYHELPHGVYVSPSPDHPAGWVVKIPGRRTGTRRGGTIRYLGCDDEQKAYGELFASAPRLKQERDELLKVVKTILRVQAERYDDDHECFIQARNLIAKVEK